MEYSQPVRVLLVEDDEDDYTIVRNLLSGFCTSGNKLSWASDFDEGIKE